MQNSGIHISGYTISGEIGRGGMGVVYLATDEKLDRQVAIKALPADLAADPDRLARFQREAKVLASLNHPNVGGIHGLEQADGHQYLVLEYVEGETLADRLSRGPIPIDESLALAKQIAEALEAAHEKGIVHRDLKPGNVMVTPDGAAKVLDFGLARTGEGNASSTSGAALANSPTITSPARHSPTVPGVIMGTAGYMSPEQARGKSVDRRSDIFSFGCVLYEMLTGAGPFPGETATDSLGAILHREPGWALLPPATPARVRELLTNCLAKDRKSRLHDIGDARLELERTIAGHEWTSVAAAASARRTSRLVLGVIGCVAVVLAGAAGWLLAGKFTRPLTQAPAQTLHLSTTTPAKPELRDIVGIAPDARFIIYTAWPELEADSTKPPGVLVVRRLDRDETKVLENTEGASSAALSPDGRWLTFAAAKDRIGSKVALKKLALEDGRPSGAPETLCELPRGEAPSLCWSSDREIIIATAWQSTMLAVSASGGEPRVVLREETAKEIDNWGEVRPLVAGRSILATRWALVGQTIKERTEIVDLASGKRTPLLSNAGGTQYVTGNGEAGGAGGSGGGGYILARRVPNSLIAARFDLDKLQIIGEPVTLLTSRSIGSFLASPSGTLAMRPQSGDPSGRKLAWLDEQGRPQPISAPPRAYGGSLDVSPDGGRVVVNLDPIEAGELPVDLWVHDLARRTFTRLPTQGPSWAFIWSRDGQRLTYAAVTKDEFAIWERRIDGSGEPVKLYSSGSPQVMAFPSAWSPDGKLLAVTRVDFATQKSEVLILEQEAGSKAWVARPYLNSSGSETNLAFSPDGKWVRFNSDESGRGELYVQRFTGPGAGAEDAKAGRVPVTINGGNGHGWMSPDGKELRYCDADNQIMSVQIQTEPTFSASAPKLLYSIKGMKIRNSTIAPDGRLLAVLEGENERVTSIDIVVNFFEELRAKIGAAK